MLREQAAGRDLTGDEDIDMGGIETRLNKSMMKKFQVIVIVMFIAQVSPDDRQRLSHALSGKERYSTVRHVAR